MTAAPGDAITQPADTGAERVLRTRVAELEAEVAELREAAAHARDLAATAGAAQAALHDEIAELHATVERLSTLRGSLHALQRAAVRRARYRDEDGQEGPDYRRAGG